MPNSQEKSALVIGFPRKNGYSEAMVDSLVNEDLKVFITSSDPNDEKERAANEMGASLIKTPLNFDVTEKEKLGDTFDQIIKELKENGVDSLGSLIQLQAGGVPRSRDFLPYLRGIQNLSLNLNDLPDDVIKNVTYVNAESHGDTIKHLSGVLNSKTCIISTSFREAMPGYIIDSTKRLLEQTMREHGKAGRNTLAIAIPKIITESSKIYEPLLLFIVNDYLKQLYKKKAKSDQWSYHLKYLEEQLMHIEGINEIFEKVEKLFNAFTAEQLTNDPAFSRDPRAVNAILTASMHGLEEAGLKVNLKTGAGIISNFVRRGCTEIITQDLIINGNYNPGETRRITYETILKNNGSKEPFTEEIDTSDDVINISALKETPTKVDEKKVKEVLKNYGPSFLLIDSAEISEDGQFARGKFKVPFPASADPKERADEVTTNDKKCSEFMRDHFVGSPLMPGVLQQEATSQLAVLLTKIVDGEDQGIMLEGLDKVKFDTMIFSGDEINLEVEILEKGKRNRSVRFKIECNGKTSSGVVNAFVMNEGVFKRKYRKEITIRKPE